MERSNPTGAQPSQGSFHRTKVSLICQGCCLPVPTATSQHAKVTSILGKRSCCSNKDTLVDGFEWKWSRTKGGRAGWLQDNLFKSFFPKEIVDLHAQLINVKKKKKNWFPLQKFKNNKKDTQTGRQEETDTDTERHSQSRQVDIEQHGRMNHNPVQESKFLFNKEKKN